jgi:branched-chain amino acid transport system substrate-binding protein
MAKDNDGFLSGEVSRRELMKKAGVGAGGVMLASLISACGGSSSTTTTAAATAATSGGGSTPTTGAAPAGTIKIGFVSPRTGPAAGFGEGDPYVLDLARKALAPGLTVGGKLYTVEIIDKDGQSAPAQGAAMAQELINSNGIDLMLTTSTPETTNPVADACEAAGVPCISTVCPWEAWYFGRGAKAGEPSPFKFSYHMSFGVNEFYKAYTTMWPQVPTNKIIAVMWPNDADGNAIRAALGPLLVKDGYTIVDPGAYQDGTNDYSSQIAQFKSAGCEIFDSFPLPPDFATFWRQAAQQGFVPKIAQVAKTGLFPSQVEALGDLGRNLAGGVYWSPAWPYKSPLTGVTSQELGDGYEQASSKQWTCQLGATMSLFDAGTAALQASTDPKNKQAVADAIAKLKVDTIVGTVDWTSGPVPNVSPTPFTAGQWVKGTKWPYDFVICENANDTKVPIQAKLQQYR